MKRLIFNLLFFISPFVILCIITELFYVKSGGDLNRLGKINIDKHYRAKFEDDFNQTQHYLNFSQLDLYKTNTFNILTIGDSFSQQGAHGYQNYIKNPKSTLNFNTLAYNLPTNNPIDLTYKLCNENVFNNLKVNYLILQLVERNIITRSEELDLHSGYSIEKIISFKKTKQHNNSFFNHIQFSDYIKFPAYSILYNFSNNAYFSSIHQTNINKKLFSSNNKLLFLKDDLSAIERNNDITNIKNLNKKLNILSRKLKERNTTLIVLPSPDKYDIHYDYITTKNKPEPLFFDHLKKLNKDYLYIDSKQVLKEHIDNGVKDVYFVDDSHWSPIGAKIIANSITETITKHN